MEKGKVLSFDSARKKAAVKKQAPVDKETYLLWQVSQSVDDVITDAVVTKNLKIEEVSAVLAHRLGTLLKTADDPERLKAFCETLIKRILEGESAPAV